MRKQPGVARYAESAYAEPHVSKLSRPSHAGSCSGRETSAHACDALVLRGYFVEIVGFGESQTWRLCADGCPGTKGLQVQRVLWVSKPLPEISLADYAALVDWTGRIARPDVAGVIVDECAAVTSIRGSPRWWACSSLTIEAAFGCAVGRPARLKVHAEATGRRSVRGVGIR